MNVDEPSRLSIQLVMIKMKALVDISINGVSSLLLLLV